MKPLPGQRRYLADTSAWARVNRPAVAPAWEAALNAGQIATCSIVTLELLHSTRDGADFDATRGMLSQLRDIPITPAVWTTALEAYRALAHRQPLFHRSVKLPDLLVGAAAADAGLGVLHYDEDFDTLATVLDFESRWIATRGSLD